VPRASIGWWTHRFVEKGVTHEALVRAFGEPVLRFRDPDGIAQQQGDAVEAADRRLLGHPAAGPAGRIAGLVGADAALRYGSGTVPGGFVTLRAVGEFLPGRTGAGSVHHSVRPRAAAG
jgi:glyoxalase family protein